MSFIHFQSVLFHVCVNSLMLWLGYGWSGSCQGIVRFLVGFQAPNRELSTAEQDVKPPTALAVEVSYLFGLHLPSVGYGQVCVRSL